MLVPFAELLARADAQGRAVGGFTAYNLDTAVAVLNAAADRDVGVMLLISQQAFGSRAGDELAQTLVALGAQAPIPSCVQLDHVASLEVMERAFEAGIGAVMADGSELSYEENVELVCAAVALASRFGGGVEAELGRIEGDEEVARAAKAGKLTDPGQAALYLEQTGAACLAVSIGNAHGRYLRPPKLDLGRLEQIHAVTPVPLSLHGASGLSEAHVVECVRRGVRKVNVNTELRDRYFEVVSERVAELRTGARLLALHEELIDALTQVVEAKLSLFDSPNTATTSRPPKEASGDRRRADDAL